MLTAVFKLYYNKAGENELSGGICGSAFFISEYIALSANHVLQEASFLPGPNFKNCELFLISKFGNIIPISKKQVTVHPEYDLAIIRFKEPQQFDINQLSKLSFQPSSSGEEIIDQGFVGGTMPQVIAKWKDKHVHIDSANLFNNVITNRGTIKSIKRVDVNSSDLKIKNVIAIETSFGGVVGMSGSPLIKKRTGEVIGIMSFGLPAGQNEKKSLYAISIEQIIPFLEDLK